MTQPWYPFYVGDYIRKTAHLSLIEHGAYHLLIDHYMATSSPLPKDPSKLYRICRATSPTERKSVMQIVNEFFYLDGDSYRNKKCDSEIGKQLNFSNSQSAKAKIRHASGKCPNDAESMPTTTTTTTNRLEANASCQFFETFWNLYPSQNRSKGSKKKAKEIFAQAIKKVSVDSIMAGTKAYADYLKNSVQSSADAFRWLQQERWADDYGFTATNPDPQRRSPSFTDVSFDKKTILDKVFGHAQ